MKNDDKLDRLFRDCLSQEVENIQPPVGLVDRVMAKVRSAPHQADVDEEESTP
jgi:hypothetical protein